MFISLSTSIDSPRAVRVRLKVGGGEKPLKLKGFDPPRTRYTSINGGVNEMKQRGAKAHSHPLLIVPERSGCILTLPRSEIERVAGTPDLSGRAAFYQVLPDKSGVPGEVPGRTRAIAKQVLDIC